MIHQTVPRRATQIPGPAPRRLLTSMLAVRTEVTDRMLTFGERHLRLSGSRTRPWHVTSGFRPRVRTR
jgi:hypothetical protein